MGQGTNEGGKSLYVGNLDPRVTEETLAQIFSVIAPVDNVKIKEDRNFTHGGLKYGFVEFHDRQSAEQALQAMTGKRVFNHEIHVNWASQGSAQKEDTSNHFNIFVGDLSPEVNDETLSKAFRPFKTISEARVMWDQTTGKSRGFGFVAFRDKTDAEQAIATMNGERLGSRAIRCNWANQKNTAVSMPMQVDQQFGMSSTMSYEQIFAQTPPYLTTVYVGNLPRGITQQEIMSYFHSYGYVSDIRVQADRGFAFVKMDTHANATTAIFALQGSVIGGRQAKLSWGKDRTANPGSTPQYEAAAAYQSYNYPYQNWPSMVAGPPQGGNNAGLGSHGWDQYYQQQQQQQYYSAGHN